MRHWVWMGLSLFLVLAGCDEPSDPQNSAIDCTLAGGQSVLEGGRHVGCLRGTDKVSVCRRSGGDPMYDRDGNFKQCRGGGRDIGADVANEIMDGIDRIGDELDRVGP